MRLNVDSVVAHVGKHFPGDRLSTAQARPGHALGINEHGKRVAKFFEDRPGDFVLRFPAVIESNYGASWRDVFFTALPGEKILQANNSNAAILKLLHLRFE